MAETTKRAERHTSNAGIAMNLRDLILGGQDGLVNVLGLVLGLTGAGSDAHVVIVGGMAALLAESIAMGGVQYTSLSAEVDYYYAELARERREVEEVPEEKREEIRRIFRHRGLHGDLLERVVEQITAEGDRWVQVMMRDGSNLSEPTRTGLVRRAILVGISCAVGSAIPIAPYAILPIEIAPYAAVVLCALALFGVGAYKAMTLIGSPFASGVQMLTIGMASALAGYLIGLALHITP